MGLRLTGCAWTWRGSPGCGRTDRRWLGASGAGIASPHPTRVGVRLASPGSPDVSSSRRSRRERFNWQDFGLRTDVASLGLEAGRVGAGAGAGRSGEGERTKLPGETPAGRPWREEIRQEEVTTGRQRQRKGTEDTAGRKLASWRLERWPGEGAARPASARDHPLSVSAQPHPRQQT